MLKVATEMNSSNSNNALLPSGFEDLLPPQAEDEYAAIAALMGSFTKFGYQRVKPPMAEFEDSLLAPGPGAALASETFRVMDPVTHRMMGLRSDITAQIARIALSRLAEEERPLRLTYANDVIRTKASQARTQRQFTQVGCELIGVDSADADAEIAVIALKALHDAGVKDVTIDFATPQIVEDIFEATGHDRADIDALRHQLSGPADKAFKALDEIGLPELVQPLIDRLKHIVATVEEAAKAFGFGYQITIDPLETRGFEYHNGIVFTLFAKSIRGELGRGGRYDIYEGQMAKESAAGFTLYMDTLRQGIEPRAGKDTQDVEAKPDWSKVKQMQDKGIVTKLNHKDGA